MKRVRVKRERLEFDGIVMQAYKGGKFDVDITIEAGTKKVLATLCGKMRQRFIKVVPGDAVIVELSEYDTDKGRIVRRIRK